MKLTIATLVAAAPLLISSIHAGSADLFLWLDSGESTPIVQEVKKAFSEELRPDIPEKVKPYVPILYKYLAHIGVYKTSCLVIIGYRERADTPKEYDAFEAFSYDLDTQKKERIQPKDYYYQWTFVKLASFEPSPTPDIIFSYFDCLECEKVELLSSFRFDPKEKRWKTRVWPENDPHLMIGSDNQFGEDVWMYDCLYSFADFTSDGYADIAIRCRETGEQTGRKKDEALLYTIQKGTAQKRALKDKIELKRINHLLCGGKSSPLCK